MEKEEEEKEREMRKRGVNSRNEKYENDDGPSKNQPIL